MRLKVFIGSTLSVLVTVLTSPVVAQPTPSGDDRRPQSAPPTEPAAPGSTGATPESAPQDTLPPPPAPEGPTAEPSPPADAPVPPPPTAAVPLDTPEMVEPGTMKIGSVLSPLLVTTGLGYAYASVTHPELLSRSLSGAFLEITAGTEIERRFRLSLAFTSFETKVRRTRAGWEEGEFSRVASSGLRTQADPVDPTMSPGGGGGLVVQKDFLAHSLGPRMDFLPLGSQGPYLGMTAALGIIQGLSTSMRVGANLAARIGGEWRPFQAFALAIEGGAHGQIYSDAKAAIPYVMARMTLLLEPSGPKGTGLVRAPTTILPTQRTLPAPTPR
jgi:hypothetical protein